MKKLILSLLLIIAGLQLKAQEVENSGNLIQGGLEDGEKLLNAYIRPLNKAIVYGLSNVTYTKLRDKNDKKRLLLSLKMAYVSLPDEDKTFDVSKLDLQTIEAKDPTKTIAQTIFGDSLKSITLASKNKDLIGRPLFEFDSPKGGQANALPIPYIGLNYRMKNTNLSFGLIPYVKIPTSDLQVGMLNLSVQKDVASFIKTLEDKDFGISLQAGAAVLYGHAPLDVQPDGVTFPVSVSGSHTGPYDNQEVNIIYTSATVGIFADYKLMNLLTLFAGAGYNFGTSRILVSGKYPIYTSDPSGSASLVATDVVDPLDMSSEFSRMKYELGSQVDLGKLFIRIHYNLNAYGGLGATLGYKL